MRTCLETCLLARYLNRCLNVLGITDIMSTAIGNSDAKISSLCTYNDLVELTADTVKKTICRHSGHMEN